ncbi:hypothetical protein A3715_18260 [Oleiphilus sp. HI0009]
MFSKLDIQSVSPIECDLNKGDIVIYTNDYGVEFELTIAGFGQPSKTRPEAFIYLDKDSWWYPVERQSLKLKERHKSIAASFVLSSMDANEDGPDSYNSLVKLAAEKFNIGKVQVERELEPFI